MGRGDGLAADEVGDGARYLEDAVVGTGRHVVFGHHTLEDGRGIGIEGTILLHQARVHLRVAMHARLVGEALGLYFSRRHDAGANVGTTLPLRPCMQLVEGHRHYLALYVYTADDFITWFCFHTYIVLTQSLYDYVN